MLIYGRKIVILPFKRDAGDSRVDRDIAGKEDHRLLPNSSMGTTSGSSKVSASYILDLTVIQADNKVNNIIDIQFLHGYHQPTLLILYEPLKTCPGRIAVRKDTCRLDVLTLDIKERISACIWSKEVLPFDCVGAFDYYYYMWRIHFALGYFLRLLMVNTLMMYTTKFNEN